MLIYCTTEWKGYGKQNYYHNEYRMEDGKVVKYRCNRYKHFDGHENSWQERETLTASWSMHDPDMPDWLRKYL